jgi:pyruvate/oxaloacetate carboxyltransferase
VVVEAVLRDTTTSGLMTRMQMGEIVSIFIAFGKEQKWR